MSEKLIVCSVVEAANHTFAGYIQAWSIDSLEDNLSRQRRLWAREFLPVAAFLFDPERLMQRHQLIRLPADVRLGWLGLHFGRTPMISEAYGPIFRHYPTLSDGGSALFAAWTLAVNLDLKN